MEEICTKLEQNLEKEKDDINNIIKEVNDLKYPKP